MVSEQSYVLCSVLGMPVAKKGFLGNYSSFIFYVLVGVLVGGSLLGLQLRCMNNDQNSFVSSYCLSDNHSRAIVSAIMTVACSLMTVALVDCICSFRTSKLSTGIEEGVYVALGSMDRKYCLRCMRTRWWAVILLVLLLLRGPGLVSALFSHLFYNMHLQCSCTPVTDVLDNAELCTWRLHPLHNTFYPTAAACLTQCC